MSLVVAKSAIKDHWADWTESYVPAPPFNVKEYQEKLDDVCGVSRDVSIMKLEWGGDATIAKYTEWDAFGKPSRAEIVPRFAIPRTHATFGTRVYIPVRRWIISELKEPEQSLPDDDFDNTFTDEYGATCRVSEKPIYQYVPYIYVGDHSKCPPNCCKERLCLGDYKAPGKAELDYLLKCTYNLKKDFFCDPRSIQTDAQLEKINREIRDKQEKRRETLENDLNDESKDWFNAHGHRIKDDYATKPIWFTKK